MSSIRQDARSLGSFRKCTASSSLPNNLVCIRVVLDILGIHDIIMKGNLHSCGVPVSAWICNNYYAWKQPFKTNKKRKEVRKLCTFLNHPKLLIVNYFTPGSYVKCSPWFRFIIFCCLDAPVRWRVFVLFYMGMINASKDDQMTKVRALDGWLPIQWNCDKYWTSDDPFL